MKGKIIYVGLVVITVILILLLSVITPGLVHAEDVDTEVSDYIVRDPIRINDNSDFAAQATAEGWPGDGSEFDPYVIEGYEIDGTGYGYGIYVGNTTVHFVVRGCYVHNASGVDQGGNGGPIPNPHLNTGIILISVPNSIIENNTLINNVNRGIYLAESGDTEIIDNMVLSNDEGIRLSYSNNNVLKNNIICDNVFGISLAHSVENTIIHNKIYHEKGSSGSGINLQHSDNNFINNNTISNYRIGIWGINSFDNVVEDNTFMEIVWVNILFEEVVNGRIPDSENYFEYLDLIYIAAFSIAVAIIVITLIIWKRKDKQK